MLSSLSIKDLLLIDRLELEFAPGLNALTGETGAGKSILLDALGFALGWRGRGDVVRQGADSAEVTAVFDLEPNHPALAILDDAGLPSGQEVILRRSATTQGRKQAFVNDRRVSADVLRALSDVLVELHGQNDDRGLLNHAGHRALLDAFAGLERDVAQVGALWRAREAARRALADAQVRLEKMRADEDYLRHALDEMQTLDPRPGEDADLDRQRRLMQAAERIRGDVGNAAQALGPQGAEGPMADALRWLEGAAGQAEGLLEPAVEAMSRALNSLAEAEQVVASAFDQLTVDGPSLEAVEERLFAIRGLARKHNVQPDELATLSVDIAARVDALDQGDGDIARLRDELGAADAAYDAAAVALSAARRKAAKNLDKDMGAELPPLKLERARFETGIDQGTPGPAGRDEVRFTVATNPGTPPGPLGKIASGGELSRFLLALKVCLSRGAQDQTLIFDEIDRGVGGATADAVGRRLADLGRDAQVLVVTHSPQVAARAAHHWRVAKRVEAGATLSTVEPLDETGRQDEIARMLAGDRITAEARAAAKVLMADEG